MCTTEDGGCGGDDVVNNENVFVDEVFGRIEDEGATDVLLSLGRGEFCLACVVVLSGDGVGVDGYVGVLADAFGEFEALVVASLHLAALGNGYGQDEVNGVEEVCAVEVFHH